MALELLPPSLLLITTQLTSTIGQWTAPATLLLGDVSKRLPTQQTEGSIKAADEGIKAKGKKKERNFLFQLLLLLLSKRR